ncbi:16S rRNA (guanine(966)-N(2))-methyltransferase RsmD [Mycoplasma buteonis]|uniref:16S rRNA (guanine(966)-N(2))-methyltransferase RsmD n=1 Tax=Mycoplasma buteonis TaxID=171280 RepID=UPI00055E63FA|nr:16S rRNA (guanine(966)-N(2))-methyltransferase RsmD [Mycoplasma buteonis]
MIRVIAGKYRHIKLEQPNIDSTRPTTDKVREAVFSSLQFKLEGKSCLDLFSGSGAWAIEAASRGAQDVVALDLNKIAYRTIVNNVKIVKADNISVLNTDARNFVTRNSQPFDFIFIDAPFKQTQMVNEILKTLAHKETLNADGEIIIETDVADLIEVPERYRIFKEKRYGKINLIYLCRAED